MICPLLLKKFLKYWVVAKWQTHRPLMQKYIKGRGNHTAEKSCAKPLIGFHAGSNPAYPTLKKSSLRVCSSVGQSRIDIYLLETQYLKYSILNQVRWFKSIHTHKLVFLLYAAMRRHRLYKWLNAGEFRSCSPLLFKR